MKNISVDERYKLWSEHEYFDQETRQELQSIKDRSEIEDRFYTDLEFGTGGMRGIFGGGTNRMNKYVIRKVTQGLADMICANGEEAMECGVVIAYDSRHFSQEFAWESALILAKNNISAYIFEELRPTPLLSFAVRHLKAEAGIVVTASHNPKNYNGYKVYAADGSQIGPTQADLLLSYIDQHSEWTDLLPLSKEEGMSKGLIRIIGREVDEAYLAQVQTLSLYPELNRAKGAGLKIAYTPLHGAGNVLVRAALQRWGFSSVWIVKEQEKPDPDFTTVPYPNPENLPTFDLVKKLGTEVQADLVLASDPDSDRLGVAVRDVRGEFVHLTGNEVGILLTYYILTQKQALGILPEKAAVIKTIVSSDMVDAIGKSLGVQVESVLTGFKFIAEKEREMDEGRWGEMQFAFEESIGYRAGKFVRDKDAIIAAVLVSEMTLFYKEKEQKTLPEVLEGLYHQFGFYGEDTISMNFAGREGKEVMDNIMENLRQEHLQEFGGIPIERIEDYSISQGKYLSDQTLYPLKHSRSNVLRFSFAGGGFVTARPSGTEPKIKFYFCIKGKNRLEMEQKLSAVKEEFFSKIEEFIPKP